MNTRYLPLLLCLGAVLWAGISASAQRFGISTNIAAGYDWRRITVNSTDTVVQDIKKTMHDDVDRPAISCKFGLDMQYKRSSSSWFTGSVAMLNYRELKKMPGFTLYNQGFVSKTVVPPRKTVYTYYYMQAGLGYRQALGKRKKAFIGAAINLEVPLFYVFAFKQGRARDMRMVHRREETKNNPQVTLSPELIAGRDFTVSWFSFSVYASAQYFLKPLYGKVPIEVYPMLGHIGCLIPMEQLRISR